MNKLDKMVYDTRTAFKEYEKEKQKIKALEIEIHDKNEELVALRREGDYDCGLATQDMGFYDIGHYIVEQSCDKCKNTKTYDGCESCSFFYDSKYEVEDES